MKKTIGQLISAAIKLHELNPETVESVIRLPKGTLTRVMNDEFYTNAVPVLLFKNLILSLHIPFPEVEAAMLPTFNIVLSKETPETIKAKPPYYRLWENEEAVLKYTARLKELMNTKSYVPSPSGQSAEDWQLIFDAPKDGTEIWIGYYSKDGITDECVARWSERPVCMLGDRNGGFPPGWATAGDDTDKNLPVDPPQYWKPLEGAKWALSQSPQIDEYIIDFIEWAVKQSETVRMQNADSPQDIYQLYLNDKNKQ